MNQLALKINIEKRTQKQDIIDYLRCNGSITRMEAFDRLGVCELSSRIGELEREGYRFNREWLDGEATNGRKWRVVQYSMA